MLTVGSPLVGEFADRVQNDAYAGALIAFRRREFEFKLLHDEPGKDGGALAPIGLSQARLDRRENSCVAAAQSFRRMRKEAVLLVTSVRV